MHSIFNEAAIRKELPGIILLSHGKLALGMLDTVHEILGKIDNIAAFALEAGDDPTRYREAFAQAVESFPAGVVILVDMFGGSPCNQLFIAAPVFRTEYCAFSGMSLPLILEASTMRELCTGDELKAAILAAASHAIKDLNSAIAELSENGAQQFDTADRR